MSNINTARPMIMHIDLNSCFATIEQQSRPLLRGRPVAIVNRATEHTAIVTASYEAKQQGIGVGMKLATARLLCPALVALESDPVKYRFVYRKLMGILQDYSPYVRMKSIDEGLIDFAQSSLEIRQRELADVGREIKQRLRDEIGNYMRCNIGIGTNRFLAKTAAGLNKPDGLTEITHKNLREVYRRLGLEDLTGIAHGYGKRLREVGITTPLEFLDADELTLEKQVFHGKPGRDWYQRLRGWEVDAIDSTLQSVGRQFVLDERNLGYDEVLRRFHGLCEDVAAKLRHQSVWARTVRIYVKSHGKYWQSLHHEGRAFHDESTIFTAVEKMLRTAPLPAIEIGVTCTDIVSEPDSQAELFSNEEYVENITQAIDKINLSWGDHTVHSADTLGLANRMKRKVPFGSTRYL